MPTNAHQHGIGVSKTEELVEVLNASKRARLLAVAWFGVVLVLLTTFSFPASADTVADERQFVQLINELRASKGLQPLLVDNELKMGSRAWSQEMANKDTLEHANDLSSGITSNWSVLGENVGVTSGSDVRVLFDKFVASPDHLRNLVDPEFSHVGVGVVYDAQGKLWTTHRFMAVSGSSPPPATAPPAPAPTAAPVPVPTPTTQLPVETVPPPTTAPPVTSPPTTTVPEPSSIGEQLLADVFRELATA